MDNEEIRELLRELKEKSDEGNEVKGRVVKIHFDTPWETERKERRRKREALEAQKREEEARREAEKLEEEKARAAEEAARAAVEEAKAQAAAEFSPDLMEDLVSPAEEEAGPEEEPDLQLNWSMDRSERVALLLREAGETGDEPDDGPEAAAAPESAAGTADSEEAGEAAAKRHAASGEGGMKQRLLAAKAGLGAMFAGSGKKTAVKKHADAEQPAAAEEEAEAEAYAEEAATVRGDSEEPAAVKKRAGSGQGGWLSRFMHSPDSEPMPDDDDFRQDGEEAAESTARAGRKRSRRAGRQTGAAQSETPEIEAYGEDVGATDDEFTDTGDDRAVDSAPSESDGTLPGGGETLPGETDVTDESEEAAGAAESRAESAGDETDDNDLSVLPGETPDWGDWEDEEEEERATARQRLRAELARRAAADLAKEGITPETADSAAASADTTAADTAAGAGPAAAGAAAEAASGAGAAGAEDAGSTAGATGAGMAAAGLAAAGAIGGAAASAAAGNPADGSTEQTTEGAASGAAGVNAGGAAGAAAGADSAAGAAAGTDSPADTAAADAAAEAESSATLDRILGAAAGTNGADGAAAGGETPAQDGTGRQIEVVDLNEHANNQSTEVIHLDKPASDGSAHARRIRRPELSLPKLLAIAGGVLVAALAIGLGARQASRSRALSAANVTADEGLTVYVKSQPQTWTSEGDVTLDIRTGEAIQSVTVNGENQEFSGETRTTVTFTATDNDVDLMVVTTDRVLNADITLDKVDSEPPAVTVSGNDGKVALSASDPLSGVAAIYYGKVSGLSDVPQYTEYTTPFEAGTEELISYYAQDNAGNRSVPVTSSMQCAESISFGDESISLYPGQTYTLELQTEPEHAYLNNRQFSISNTSVVTLENGNILRAVADGDAYVTASADGMEDAVLKVSVRTERQVTISAIGDCTLGTDENFSPLSSFNTMEEMYGTSYFFENVRSIFEADDVTFANFEGVLTTLDTRADKEFAFRGDPSYAEILADGSVEVVNLSNNHSQDYGYDSLTDTRAALESAGIEWCDETKTAWTEVNGVKVAWIGIYALDNGTEKKSVAQELIRQAREDGADLVVTAFHWGTELATEPDESQIELAHAAVDAGADLVVGHHPHVLQGIEKYNGVYICYSLGNFCFGGSVTPGDKDTMIFQQTFTLTESGAARDDSISIIPCSCSSEEDYNNYQPTPASGEKAREIMEKINQRSEIFGMTFDGAESAAESAGVSEETEKEVQ